MGKGDILFVLIYSISIFLITQIGQIQPVFFVLLDNFLKNISMELVLTCHFGIYKEEPWITLTLIK